MRISQSMMLRMVQIACCLLLTLCSAQLSQAQSSHTVVISGVVVDTTVDEPFGGVTVRGMGTTLGTTTDMQGRFSITVPRGTRLHFSFVGYRSVEHVADASRSDLRIDMEEDAQKLSEVVVIGYGTSRKEDLSTAVSTLSVGAELKSGPTNIGSIMQGRLPGVTLMSDGGDPLAGLTLNVRGKGSRSGDQVLFVVDGVPGAPYNIEDIETITVLKDAASAAIYGASVGSGGVIVITTKQAHSGRLRVDVNASYSAKHAAHLPSVTTAAEYGRVWQTVSQRPGTTLPIVADAARYPYGTTDRTAWLDEIFRTGSLQHYAVTLSGGSDKLRAIASVSYDRNEGTLINTYQDFVGAKLSAQYDLNRWMSLKQTFNAEYSNGQGGVNTDSHEGVILGAIFYPTSATIYELDESGQQVIDASGQPLYGGTIPRRYVDAGISGYGEVRNPVARLLRLRQYQPDFNFFSSTALTLMPLRGLTLQSTLSTGMGWSRSEDFSPRIPEPGLPSDINTRSIYNAMSRRWIWETTATYAALLGDKHHLSLMGGYTMQHTNWRSNYSETQGFVSEDEHLVIQQAGDRFGKPWESISDESMISAFARAGYSYDDRYFVTAVVRNDLSSKLHPDHRSAVFPAFSGSWKISSEHFFSDYRDVLTLLKVRAGWGQVGSVAAVDPYAYNTPMGTARESVYGRDTHTVTGTYQNGLSNPNLKWETTESTGVGLDLTLFGALSITVDYYHKLTRDLIERMPVVSTIGVQSEPFGNVGAVLNRGWEITADFNKRYGDWQIGVFGNLSTNRSEVQSIGDRDFIAEDYVINGMQPLRSKVGMPWQSFYVYETQGIFGSQAEIEAHKWVDPDTGISELIQPYAEPGDLRFVDQNNDGWINDDDRVYKGSYLPTLTYAFGANVAYAGLDLAVMMQGIAGNKIFNGFRMMGLTGRGNGNNMLSEVMKSYEFDPNSGIPRLGVASDPNGNFSMPSDYFLEDGSYLRLKNITLGYTLPKSVMRALQMEQSSARLYISGENLLTITKYSGMDPEVGNMGVDGGKYPISRSFTVGLNLNF